MNSQNNRYMSVNSSMDVGGVPSSSGNGKFKPHNSYISPLYNTPTGRSGLTIMSATAVSGDEEDA